MAEKLCPNPEFCDDIKSQTVLPASLDMVKIEHCMADCPGCRLREGNQTELRKNNPVLALMITARMCRDEDVVGD